MTPVLGVIPARFASVRFPGKVLAPLAGKPVIQHVWERAQRSPALTRVLIATDDARVQRAAAAFGAEAVMTRADHASGTDRIAEVATRTNEPFIVNIQSDEPFIAPEAVTALVGRLLETGAPIATCAGPLDADHADDPNTVKVVCNAAGDALYFSRSRIPYPRNEPGPLRKHFGIYGFTRAALLAVAALPPSPLELAEGLEQLRWLEGGYRIAVAFTEYCGIAIDTPADLTAAERLLAQQGAPA